MIIVVKQKLIHSKLGQLYKIFTKTNTTRGGVMIEETGRNRDMVSGSTKTKALNALYEWLFNTSHLPMFNRVFQGVPSQYVNAAFAKDGTIDGEYKHVIHLGSYNYSGLNGDTRIIDAARDALNKYGLTTSGVRLLNGTSDLHLLFEKKLAKFLGTEDVATYSSGYAANISVLNALCSERDIVLSDELNHQSIVDGLTLSKTKVMKYPHRDMDGLASLLKSLSSVQRKFIVTDGIFSMDGDLAKLDIIVDLAKKYNSFIIVDEAHATAACGPSGRGVSAFYNVVGEIDVITGSLSKGLPGIGGFAAGKKQTIDFLRYGSNGYIFSASLPPAIPAGLMKALEILGNEPEIQEKLHNNEHALRDGIKNIGLNIMHSESPVIPILLPSRDITFKLAKHLFDNGIFVNPICFPAVSRRLPRLRLNASASLSKDNIEQALHCIKDAAKSLSLI